MCVCVWVYAHICGCFHTHPCKHAFVCTPITVAVMPDIPVTVTQKLWGETTLLSSVICMSYFPGYVTQRNETRLYRWKRNHTALLERPLGLVCVDWIVLNRCGAMLHLDMPLKKGWLSVLLIKMCWKSSGTQTEIIHCSSSHYYLSLTHTESILRIVLGINTRKTVIVIGMNEPYNSNTSYKYRVVPRRLLFPLVLSVTES